MAWLIRETVERLGKTDKYYCPRRWLFYESVIRFAQGLGVDVDLGPLLEVGVRSVALNTRSTVVEPVLRPELVERHSGQIVMAHLDQPEESGVLPDGAFRDAIACQCFEHMALPEVAWRTIKRVTTRGALISIPWRWQGNKVHNRDMRDLAVWTDGDRPSVLRMVRGPRLLAWYDF